MNGGSISRRRVLTAAASAGVVVSGSVASNARSATADSTDAAAGNDRSRGLRSGVAVRSRGQPRRVAALRVKAYPGPTPDDLRTVLGWSRVHLEAAAGVSAALDRLAGAARSRTTLDRATARVDLMRPFVPDDPPSSQSAILDAFREDVHRRGAVAGDCCHLLLWWDGWNDDLGYGGTRSPNGHVAAVEDEGSQTVANIGATELWDSRSVTVNVAIHETLHTFLSDDVVSEVIDGECDHDLGSAVRVDDDTLRVSPIGTAYAGDPGIGSGTTWHGTGCADHDAFYRHDGTDGIDTWEYAPELSEGVLEAVSLYVDRYLATEATVG